MLVGGMLVRAWLPVVVAVIVLGGEETEGWDPELLLGGRLD